MTIIVYGDPVAKPRMTQRDKWKIRPCVAEYRAWCDSTRLQLKRTTKLTLKQPTALYIRAYFGSPKGPPRVGPHCQKPDFDNLLKAAADALFLNDEMIWYGRVEKYWANAGRPRVEIEWW